MRKINFYVLITLLLNTFAFANEYGSQAHLGIPQTIPLEKVLKNLEIIGANKESAGANTTLGALYLVGSEDKGIKQDYKKAYDYFLKDSEKLSFASYKIAEMHYFKLLNPNEKNCNCIQNALSWFKKLIENTNTPDYKEVSPYAKAAIGSIYLNDLGKPVLAYPYLKEAANLKSMPNYEFVIALLLNEPQLKELYNPDEAHIWLNRAWNNPDSTPQLKQTIMKSAEAVQ
ncbi:MAG: hypothetical protein ACPGUI_00395 [Halarcobacter sp.]